MSRVLQFLAGIVVFHLAVRVVFLPLWTMGLRTMRDRTFFLGACCLCISIGARFVGPDAAVWFAIIGAILLVLS